MHILRSADHEVMSKKKILNGENIEEMKLKKNDAKFKILNAENFDHAFDFSPYHEKYYDEKQQFVSPPYKGVVTWFSYLAHKEHLSQKTRKKNPTVPLLPVYSSYPLNDNYMEVLYIEKEKSAKQIEKETEERKNKKKRGERVEDIRTSFDLTIPINHVHMFRVAFDWIYMMMEKHSQTDKGNENDENM